MTESTAKPTSTPFQTGLVSIVIATKSRHDSLERLLESLYRQDYESREIIVVDDGSEPPVKLNMPEVRTFQNVESKGKTAALNLGMMHARAEFIAIFDDDVEVHDSSLLSRTIARARQFPTSGAIGFRQLLPNGSSSDMQPSHGSKLCYAGQFFGYGFMLRAEAVKRIGPFEPTFGFYYEEIELSLRLLDAGYQIIYDPSLAVIHHQDSRGRDRTKMHRLMLRNTILTGLLRCPAWSVPAVTLTALLRHIRRTWGEGRVDYAGIPWSFRQITPLLRDVRTRRKPIKLATLKMKMRLNRSPQVI